MNMGLLVLDNLRFRASECALRYLEGIEKFSLHNNPKTIHLSSVPIVYAIPTSLDLKKTCEHRKVIVRDL